MRLWLLALIFAFGACGFSPIYTRLQPRLDIVPSQIGAGRPLILTIEDMRTDKSVGQRRHGLVPGSRIELAEPVEVTVRRALAPAMMRQGFIVGGEADAGANLRVEIRELIYSPEGGAISARITTRIVLVATASTGSRRYDRIYSVTDQDNLVIASSEHYNEGRLSAMLGEALRRLATDPALLAVLTG